MENTTLMDIEAQGPGSVLEAIARRGAQQMLAQAMEAEVAEFIQQHADKVDQNGHRKVVRNGHQPARELITGIGRVAIKQPRVDDRQLGAGGDARFSSAILPRYLKRVPSVDSLIPALYLKGVSTGDFSKALQAILGKQAPGLSANSVVRLKTVWEQPHRGGRCCWICGGGDCWQGRGWRRPTARWGLGGVAGSVSGHAGAELLVPQGGQRVGQDAEVGAEQSQDDAP